MTISAKGYAAKDASSPLTPFNFERRTPGDRVVGVPAAALPMSMSSLIGKRKSISGSLIGGIAETQEILDFFDKIIWFVMHLVKLRYPYQFYRHKIDVHLRILKISITIKSLLLI